MKPTPIYLVTLRDRHQDDLLWAYRDEQKAIAFAHAKVKQYLTGNRELEDRSDYIHRIDPACRLHLRYSCEDDHIEVREVELT